jgi:monothiol glutaredoxin
MSEACRPGSQRAGRVPASKGPEIMSEQAVHDWIRKTVANNDVVLFMKGNKSFPQCGFSAQVVQILGHLGVDYKDINVLEDMGVREGIKAFSNWPTIPQLYVKGEFVGGCDIVREMFQAGELQELFKEKGVANAGASMIA